MDLIEFVNILDNVASLNREVRFLKKGSCPQNMLSWVKSHDINIHVRVNDVVFDNVNGVCLVTKNDNSIFCYVEFVADEGFVVRRGFVLDSVLDFSVY